MATRPSCSNSETERLRGTADVRSRVMSRLLFLALCLFLDMELLGRPLAYAGALPQCVAATMSANNNILVVNDLERDHDNQGHLRSSTFRVLSRYVDPNDGNRLNGPNTYWAFNLWSVVVTNSGKPPFISCPYTLVTDDGEYLIIVGGFFGEAALSIYRRRDHPGQPFGGPGPDHGVMVRQIPLSELWPPERIPDVIDDHTPEWFAVGTFSFSSDNRTLIHKTRWGTTLQITLESGQVRTK